ncbi:MAG TPA: hypothetical protein VJB61_20290, partial [Actinomycetota bacterium]
MKRTLPLLLIITAITIALAGCGTPSPRPGASGAGGSGTNGSGVAPRGGGGSAGAEGAVVKADSTAAVFRGSIATGRDTVRKRVRYSWRPGCQVGPVELRLLLVDYWGFDGRVHRGELIVHRDHARRILVVFGKLFKA